MKKNLILLYGLLLLVPVIINYGLLTWTAPGVSVYPNPWLGFLGSYLGIIGAISIALMNNNNQKKRDEEQDKKNHRSYISLQDFLGPLGLNTIKTNENSRLILTEGYNDLKNEVSKDQYIETKLIYFKISQFGDSKVILNCKIAISYEEYNGTQPLDTIVNTGVLEQGIELFVPALPINSKLGEKINLKKVIVEYSTLRNEKMRLVHNYEISKEYQSVLDINGKEHKLFEFDIVGASWTYPNKLK